MEEPSIYAVGLLRDLRKWKAQGFKIFWYWFKTSYHRRSYWNGYLCEGDNKAKCGHGWTKNRAYRSWKRIEEL